MHDDDTHELASAAMTVPNWVLDLTDEHLLDHFGWPTVQRGRDYARQSRVSQVRVSRGTHLMAAVRGSGFRGYQVLIVGPELTATCTCPIGHDCKHAVAVLCTIREQARAAQVPQWQRALEPLLSEAPEPAEAMPLALQFNDNGYGVTLRPLRMGRSGRWVKTGATWEDLRFGHDLVPEHHQVMLALLESRRRGDFTYGFRADALPLGELRPDAWRLLRRAQDVGVEFVVGEGVGRRSIGVPTLHEVATPVFHLDRDESRHQRVPGLLLSPSIELAGEELTLARHNLVGNPPHGIAVTHGEELVLAPFPSPLTQAEAHLFRVGEAVAIPDAEVAEFAAGFLPRLRDRLPVRIGEGIVLPRIAPPVLVCRVTFTDATASVRWAFRYRLGDETHDLGLASMPGEPPVRNPRAEAALAASMPEGPWVSESKGVRALRPTFLTGRPLFEFTARTLPALQARDDVIVELSSEAPSYREATQAPTVRFSVTDGTDDWFNLDVDVTIDGETVPFVELFTALARGEDHLLLESGTWFSLDHPELDRLRALIEEARSLDDAPGDGLRLRPEHAGLWEELVALGVVAEQSTAWQESVTALLDVESLPQTPVPAGLAATLRPYQQVGFAWLAFLWRGRLGGILADEMGLGKTLQSLALAQRAYEAGELDRPLLVVAPTSVLGTWASEAARFTPGLRVVTIAETQKRRGTSIADAVAGAHVVLTSYTLLRLEAAQYRAVTWSAVLLDEAQFVKNRASKAYQAVRRLAARTKIALTGTPLENNLMDLWSLLSITAPGLFADPAVFTDRYRKPIESGDAEALARLHRRIRPLVLRRTKAAVATELPDKQEQVVPIALTPTHRRIYDKHLAHERQKVLRLVDDLDGNRITILRSLTVLRQLSLAPSLVDGEYPHQSAKIDALVERVGELVAEGHRALVFSQFTGFLKLVRERFDAEGIGYEYLDGRTRDRAARIEAFREGDAPVFLISLKAGGFGLTLTEADYVFILDPWWNPAAETQAIDRTHRIGQDKPVNVYRLVSADTIEEKVVALQQRKRDLFDQVVGQASDVAAPLSADDIRGLLDA